MPARFADTTPTVPRCLIGAVAAVLVCLLLAGCVRRRMTIVTNPPGALVYVDDYKVGTTPVSADFLYYGKRKVRLVKDGYETLTVMQPMATPWYQFVPLDFVSENLVPWEIRDQRTLSYQMTPQTIVPTNQLIGRANELRFASHVQPQPEAPPSTPPIGPTPAPAQPVLPVHPAPIQPIPIQPTPLAPGSGQSPTLAPPLDGSSAPPGQTTPGYPPNGFGGQPFYPLPPGGGR